MSVNALDAQEGNNLKQNNSKKKKKGKSFTTRLKVKERRKGSEGSRCSAAFWHYYRHFLSSCGQAFTNLRTELITQLTLIWPAGSIIYSCSTLFLHGKSFHGEADKITKSNDYQLWQHGQYCFFIFWVSQHVYPCHHSKNLIPETTKAVLSTLESIWTDKVFVDSCVNIAL